jgi:transposase
MVPGCACSPKRLEKGQFSAAWKRAKSSSGYEMTLSELALFIEGSEVATRMPLSPSLLSKAALRAKFPEGGAVETRTLPISVGYS